MSLRSDAQKIINYALQQVLPDKAVASVLQNHYLPEGRLFVIAVGKAAWQMAHAASTILKNKITQGIVITKAGHVQGNLPNFKCLEGGHPVPDDRSYAATKTVIEMLKELTENDEVLFLLSGGGSALFEYPLLNVQELENITQQLLACGADIKEINTLRKRFSGVKGGRFAKACAPAKVYSIILSDVLGNQPDMIASGPTCADTTTCVEALAITKKYNLKLSEQAQKLLAKETPKKLSNSEVVITGSVSELCKVAAEKCKTLGYETIILTDSLDCEAREAGYLLGSIARYWSEQGKKRAFIIGGETVVHLQSHGKGGRNQELALAAATKIIGLDNVLIFSVGSDGTDGPTDAAGGIVDGATCTKIAKSGKNAEAFLHNNDAYNALKNADGLIITGPTGTNVNDVAVVLVE